MWEAILKWITTGISQETRVRLVSCVAFIGLVAFILFSAGYFPFFSGFAPKTALNEVVTQLKNNEAAQAKDAILTLRQTECALPKGQSKALYTATITMRMQEFYRLTGQGFQLPNCTDF